MVVGELATATDVVVIGGGPGGYVAAIRAAQLGKHVVLVEASQLGGNCLHQGCIPSKSLLNAADHAWQVHRLGPMGIEVGSVQINLQVMQTWKDGVVTRLADGVRRLLDRRRVEIVRGVASFLGERELLVRGEQSTRRYAFERCIIAVGGVPAPLPGLPFDGRRVLTAGQALRLTELPRDLTIVGSDYVAAELAVFFAKLGVPVRLLLPPGMRLLYDFDPIAGRMVLNRLRMLGVRAQDDVIDLVAAARAAAVTVVSLGIIPNTRDLDLSRVRVSVDTQGFIDVSRGMRTSNGAIFAVGDVTGGPLLASAAIKHGKVAAEVIAGIAAQYDPRTVPRVAWTDPEVASVGMTALEAEAAGYSVVSGRFPIAANGRALSLDAPEGAVLTVAERESGAILGVTVVGARAGELIGEAALAIEMGATLTDLAETLHPHPGLGETLQESAEVALGIAVHLVR